MKRITCTILFIVFLSTCFTGVSTVSNATKYSNYIPGEVLVKFKSGILPNIKADLFKKLSALSSTYLKLPEIDVLKFPADKNIDSIISKLKNDPNVLVAEPNYKITLDSISSDTYADKLWGLENYGQIIKNKQGNRNVDLDISSAWKITKGSPTTVVGIIDTGIDFNHPDLKQCAWINPGEIPNNNKDDDNNGYVDDVNGWDFANDDNTVYDSRDGDEHATHIAGTIAASMDSKGVVGIAPNVKIMSLKFLSYFSGSTETAIEAIAYARNMGVKILNNSWGSSYYSSLLQAEIEKTDALFVCSAGNSGINSDFYPMYPAGLSSKNIISVAALDNTGRIADFSNYGKISVDVAAPGVNILSTVPGGKYEYYSGTSMASPHITGIAALLSSLNVKDVSLLKSKIIAATKSLSNATQFVSSGGIASAYLAVRDALLTPNPTSTPSPTPINSPLPDDDFPGNPLLPINNNSLDFTTDQNDFYYFNATRGFLYSVFLEGSSDVDFDLFLYGPGGTSFEKSKYIQRSSKLGTGEQLLLPAFKTGKYFVRVKAYSGSGNYTLKYTSNEPIGIPIPTPPKNTAPPKSDQDIPGIKLKYSTNGYLSSLDNDYEDVYNVLLKANVPYQFVLSYQPYVSYKMMIFNRNTESIYDDDALVESSKDKPTSYINFKPKATGTYYVLIYCSYDSAPGEYNIKYSKRPETPTINKITSKSTDISGTASKDSQVILVIGNIEYVLFAENGKWKLSFSSTFAPGTKISAYVKNSVFKSYYCHKTVTLD